MDLPTQVWTPCMYIRYVAEAHPAPRHLDSCLSKFRDQQVMYRSKRGGQIDLRHTRRKPEIPERGEREVRALSSCRPFAWRALLRCRAV